MKRKGFTLIELLIVVAIIVILATVVLFVINPAQLLRQARDASRIADLRNISSAIALYLSTTDSPSLAAGPYCTASGIVGCTQKTGTAVDGTGWVGVDFSSIPSGSPMGKLPVDPVNSSCTNGAGTSTTCTYVYAGSTSAGTFEVDTVLESTKYWSDTTSDGGNSSAYYEVGSDKTLF